MPSAHDAGAIWGLVEQSGTLDSNSSYCYLVLCRYFSDTCVIARRGELVVGFLTALVVPQSPRRLFVWQIGVAPSHRGRGLGRGMLGHLLARPPCRGLSHIETTVSPGNLPSRSLFASLARDLGAPLQARETYDPEFFPEPGHEPEQRLVLGPFDPWVLTRP